MKNPTVKKIFACVAVLTVLTGSAQGAYKVEIDDDTYVSDEVYFAPVSTWDEVKARFCFTRAKKMSRIKLRRRLCR